jgi:hypothetical protein
MLLLTLVTLGSPARAQGASDIVLAGVGIGYAALSIGAVHRLIEGSDNAPLGRDVHVSVTTGASVRELSGRLTAIDADSVTLLRNGDATRIARTSLRSMSVRQGRERKWAQGWGIGFLAGVTVGALGGLASGDDTSGDEFSFTAPQKAIGLGIFGALSGSVLGSLVGALVDGDHWRSVDRLVPGTGISVTPGRNGSLNLGAHVRF